MLARQSEYLGPASLPDDDVDIDDVVNDDAVGDVDDDVDDAKNLKSFILILVQA